MSGMAWRSLLFAEAFAPAGAPRRVAVEGPGPGPTHAGQQARCGLDRVGELLEPDARQRYAAEDVEDVLERHIPRARWYLGVLGVDPPMHRPGLGASG